MTLAGREVLNIKLARLFGFEDGVHDVLDHLLTIESKEVYKLVLACIFEDVNLNHHLLATFFVP